MRGLAAATVILVTLAGAACGSQVTSTPTLQNDVVALAAAKTADAGTYRASMTGTFETAGQTLQMRGEGEFDGQKRGRMSMTTAVAGQEIDVEMVFEWPVMYMRFPPELATGLPSGKTWVKMDLETLGKQAGFDFQQLMQAGQSDPSQGLQYLQGIAHISDLGQEDVRGVSTTHYGGSVDLRQLADSHPQLAESIDRLIELTKIERVPVEVWIDGDGLVRRMRQYFRGVQFAAGVSTDMTITTELYDFGVKVDVSPPPEDQVVDLTQLLGQS